MIIRRELPTDVDAIREVTAAAFSGTAHSAPPVDPSGEPGEATLVGWLRDDPGWLPELSMVALDGAAVTGHVVLTRAHVDDRPVLALAPLSVHPDHQGTGVGSALVHAVLGAADAAGEPLVALLGDPGYYARFGFVPASSLGVVAPDPSWGDFLQVRTLTRFDGERGQLRYAAPFQRL